MPNDENRKSEHLSNLMNDSFHCSTQLNVRGNSFMFLIAKALISIPLHALACQRYHFFCCSSFLCSPWVSALCIRTFCNRICLKINLTFFTFVSRICHCACIFFALLLFIRIPSFYSARAARIFFFFFLAFHTHSFVCWISLALDYVLFFRVISEKIIQTWHKFRLEFFS